MPPDQTLSVVSGIPGKQEAFRTEGKGPFPDPRAGKNAQPPHPFFHSEAGRRSGCPNLTCPIDSGWGMPMQRAFSPPSLFEWYPFLLPIWRGKGLGCHQTRFLNPFNLKWFNGLIRLYSKESGIIQTVLNTEFIKKTLFLFFIKIFFQGFVRV